MGCLCENQYLIWKGDDFLQDDNRVQTIWECSNCKKSFVYIKSIGCHKPLPCFKMEVKGAD